MRVLKNCRGIAIVYVTLFLLVLGIIFLALGIDVGWLSYVRSQGQAATDSAALSAAAAIPNYNDGDGSKMSLLVSAYSNPADKNILNTVMTDSSNIGIGDLSYCIGDPDGIETSVCDKDPADGKWKTPGGTACFKCTDTINPAAGVKVSKPYTPRTFFARLFNGGSDATISVSSVAWLGGTSLGEANVPLAPRACEIDFPNSCKVPRLIQTPETEDNSAWTIFFFTGNDDCKKLAEGTKGPVTVKVNDDIKLVGSGQAASCLKELKDRYCKETTGNKKCNPPTGEWCGLTFPVIACDDPRKDQARVVGFATGCITEVQAQPDPKKVAVRLTCSETGDGPPGGEFFGTYANRPVLVK